MRPNTHAIAQRAVALTALTKASQRLRTSVARLGGGPTGFEGDMATMRRASEALCLMSRLERAALADARTHDVEPEDEERIRCELRAHLGTIKGYGELILEELAAGPAPEAPDPVAAQLVDVVTQASALLPLVDQLQGPKSESVPGGAPAGATGRVVVIADDPAVRQLLRDELLGLGMDGEAVESPEVGLNLAEAGSIALVICDLVMPHMGAVELVQRLHAQRTTAAIPVLVMARADEERGVGACIEAGATDFVIKPLSPSAVRARIHALLVRQRLHERERAARADLEAAVESMAEGFAIFDRELRLRSSNVTFRKLNPGLADKEPHPTLQELLRKNWDLGHYHLPEDAPPFEAWAELRVARARHAQPHMERLAGDRWLEILHNRMPTGGVVVRQIEVTRRRREEERLRYLLFHDALTALPNDAMFQVQLRHALKEGPFALLLLELDGWKGYSADHGRDAANQLLKDIAVCLVDGVRAGDLVAHLGSETFGMILGRVETIDEALELARRTCLAAKDTVGPAAQRITMRVGMAIHRGGAIDPGALMDSAIASVIEI